MLVITPNDRCMKSVFLAGPSVRGEKTRTPWRQEAIWLFQARKFGGELYVPEPFCDDYQAQIDWEAEHLERADLILFWIPRDLETLPGFTTNVEFGEWMKSGKVLLGAPSDAPKMRYLFAKARKYDVLCFHSLEAMVETAVRTLVCSG